MAVMIRLGYFYYILPVPSLRGSPGALIITFHFISQHYYEMDLSKTCLPCPGHTCRYKFIATHLFNLDRWKCNLSIILAMLNSGDYMYKAL